MLTMRVGILTVGSLYWDKSPVRCRWRRDRLRCADEHRVKVPIRYGRKSVERRGGTFTMVFAMSCSEEAKLGVGIVVPARAECCEPRHLLEEAEHLWAAERDSEEISGICASWGKVSVLENRSAKLSPPIMQAWQEKIGQLGNTYSKLSTAQGEDPVLDACTGRALFEWPTDAVTNEPLLGFDLLLMTATEPTLSSGQYATAQEIADAWKSDPEGHVQYFYNNRHYGITTFQDEEILAALEGRSGAH